MSVNGDQVTPDFELTVGGVTFKWRKVFPDSNERPYRVRVDGQQFNQPAAMTQDFVDGFITGIKMIQAINERKGESSTNR